MYHLNIPFFFYYTCTKKREIFSILWTISNLHLLKTIQLEEILNFYPLKRNLYNQIQNIMRIIRTDRYQLWQCLFIFINKGIDGYTFWKPKFVPLLSEVLFLQRKKYVTRVYYKKPSVKFEESNLICNWIKLKLWNWLNVCIWYT